MMARVRLTEPVLSWRSVVGLCAMTLILAASAAIPGLLRGGAALGGLVSTHTTPLCVVAVALMLGVACGPLLFSRMSAPRGGTELFFRTALCAVWLGVASAYFLSVAARSVPLGSTAIAQAALWCAFTAGISMLLSELCGGAYLGIVFFWAVALPVSAYFLAEVGLSGPSGGGELPEMTRRVIHWILNTSPATAAAGALTGTLADGSEYSPWAGAAVMFGVLAGLAGLSSIGAARRKM